MADRLEIRALTEAEYGRHEPPADAAESWQESWGFAWHDPIREAGGINHLSIWRRRGIADVWSWVALGGKVVGKYQCLHLKPPERDFPNWSLGGQTVTLEGPRACRLALEYADAGAELRYEMSEDPFAFPVDAEGMTWGASHYESIGRVTGTVTAGGEAVEVDGMAWQDHSWGPRRWADTLSHRWVMASFGPDLFISAIGAITAAGPTPIPIGFVYDHGRLHRLHSVSFGARVGDDGHSPEGCDARIVTADGNGYHLTGEVHTSSPSSHTEGFWITDGLCRYEMGGRMGAGIFEVQELNGPPPWLRGAMGLDDPGA